MSALKPSVGKTRQDIVPVVTCTVLTFHAVSLHVIVVHAVIVHFVTFHVSPVVLLVVARFLSHAPPSHAPLLILPPFPLHTPTLKSFTLRAHTDPTLTIHANLSFPHYRVAPSRPSLSLVLRPFTVHLSPFICLLSTLPLPVVPVHTLMFFP